MAGETFMAPPPGFGRLARWAYSFRTDSTMLAAPSSRPPAPHGVRAKNLWEIRARVVDLPGVVN